MTSTMHIYSWVLFASLSLSEPGRLDSSFMVNQQRLVLASTEQSPPPGCNRTDPPDCQPR